MTQYSFPIPPAYPRAIDGTATETGIFISGFIDVGNNRETRMLIKKVLRRPTEYGSTEDPLRAATAGEANNHNHPNARSPRLIQNEFQFASLSDSPRGNWTRLQKQLASDTNSGKK